MKLSINQSELMNALTIVQKGISARSTMPVLAGIYMQAQGDEVIFQATDLELSIQYSASALVEEEGQTEASAVTNLPSVDPAAWQYNAEDDVYYPKARQNSVAKWVIRV